MVSILESFKKVFSTGHKGVILGIDIGSSSIKVVAIEKVEEKAVLRNYGEIALGPRAGKSSGQATNLPPEKIAEALRDLLKEMGIVAHHTLMAIPFSASLLTVAELPDVEKKELESMIPIEARRYIPVPITEVSLDWWVLPKRKAEVKAGAVVAAPVSSAKQIGKTEVIIAAIHNEIIKKYESIKRDAQIPGEASHFEIEIFSTLRAVVGRDLLPTLVIDIGAGSTKLALVDEGVVRGSHVISSGGQDITLALSRSRQLSLDQAEEIKCRVGMIGDEEGRDVLVVSELIIANIMNEAARFTENYERKYNTKISKVILVGGGARLKGIEKIVAQNFPNASFFVGDPFARVDTPAFLSSTLKELSPNFAVAIGIALKGLEE
ncbi:MAG: type IV pilus assembly protein PilM [Candidatus Yonathbacteria bacterium]|nr:type IV pilus assembly protein PilM [Candidatus Yonathbacteria bacterium]